MKIGKTEVDNNLIFLLLALLVAYFIFRQLKTGVLSIFGSNPDDVAEGEVLEKLVELKGYSPLTPQYSTEILKTYGTDAVGMKKLIAKTPYLKIQQIALDINNYLHTLYVTDEIENKVMGLIDTLPTQFQVSVLAYLYPKYAKGAILESDLKKYIDAGDLNKLLKKIIKKPVK
jgi:hypothetical protein